MTSYRTLLFGGAMVLAAAAPATADTLKALPGPQRPAATAAPSSTLALSAAVVTAETTLSTATI